MCMWCVYMYVSICVSVCTFVCVVCICMLPYSAYMYASLCVGSGGWGVCVCKLNVRNHP